jgi:hypothetical protein
VARDVGDGAGDHYRQGEAVLVEDLVHREGRGLGVEGVEDGLDQQDVRANLAGTTQRPPETDSTAQLP